MIKIKTDVKHFLVTMDTVKPNHCYVVIVINSNLNKQCEEL